MSQNLGTFASRAATATTNGHHHSTDLTAVVTSLANAGLVVTLRGLAEGVSLEIQCR